MSMVLEYGTAQRAEEMARLQRMLALRAMVATGMTQRKIARHLGISQPAVSQQLKSAAELVHRTHPEELLDAGGHLLAGVANAQGFARLAVFGSVARRQGRPDSDIDLLVEPPRGVGLRELDRLRGIFEAILGRPVDLVTYAGLKPGIDDDVRAEAVLL